MKLYDTYRFRVTEQDPFVDQIRTLKKDSEMSWEQIAAITNVSVQTYRNWDNGKTRRPQMAPAIATAVALGCEYIDLRSAKRGHIVLVRREAPVRAPRRPVAEAETRV